MYCFPWLLCAALYDATEACDEEKVEKLLKVGILPNDYKSPSKQTCLHVAAQSGCEGIMQLLLTRKANVLATDNYGATCLHHAAGHGHLPIVKMLIEHGAQQCIAKTFGTEQQTPEQYARDKGHAEIADYLSQVPAGK